MTAEMPQLKEVQDPLIDMNDSGENQRDLLAEVRILLLAARRQANAAKAKRLSAKNKKLCNDEALLYRQQADQLIAAHYGLDLNNPDDHLALVSNRARLRQEAIDQQGASRAAYEVGRKAFMAAKQPVDAGLDNQRRAAGEAVKHSWDDD